MDHAKTPGNKAFELKIPVKDWIAVEGLNPRHAAGVEGEGVVSVDWCIKGSVEKNPLC